MNSRSFYVGNEEKSVDDVMIGIPGFFRDEFVGKHFADYKALTLCLTHADVAKRARITGDWRYSDALRAMREYLK